MACALSNSKKELCTAQVRACWSLKAQTAPKFNLISSSSSFGHSFKSYLRKGTMLKVVEIFVGGILTGLIPSGVALGIKWFKDKRAEKNGCRYILRVDAQFIPCVGLPSMTCAERLCPAHCQEVHKGECFKNFQKG